MQVLLLEVSGVYTQRIVLLQEMSTPQGPERHLEVSTIQRHVLHREVSTPQGPELHVDMSTL